MATFFAYIRSYGVWGRKLIADVDPAAEDNGEEEPAEQSPIRSIPLQMDEIVLVSEQKDGQEDEDTATRNLQQSFEGAAIDV